MASTKWLNAFAVGLAAVAVGTVALKNYRGNEQGEILNVSYDPTREVYKEINSKFVPKYESETRRRVRVEQSHGGSSRQARAVAEGLPPMSSRLQSRPISMVCRGAGLLPAIGKTGFPTIRSLTAPQLFLSCGKPIRSTLKDRPDLIGRDITIVTPDPNTFGNGKLSLLAAWGSIIYRGGTEEQACEFITKIYHNVPTVNQSDRAETTALRRKKPPII